MKALTKRHWSTEKTMMIFIIGGLLLGVAMGLLVGIEKGFIIADISLGSIIGLLIGIVTGIYFSNKLD